MGDAAGDHGTYTCTTIATQRESPDRIQVAIAELRLRSLGACPRDQLVHRRMINDRAGTPGTCDRPRRQWNYPAPIENPEAALGSSPACGLWQTGGFCSFRLRAAVNPVALFRAIRQPAAHSAQSRGALRVAIRRQLRNRISRRAVHLLTLAASSAPGDRCRRSGCRARWESRVAW